MKSIFLLFSSINFTLLAFGQTPNVKKYFDWYNKNYTIENPAFSHSDTEIAIVTRFNIPDGHSAEGREQYVDSLLTMAGQQKRFGDPVVSILNLKSKELVNIDYGWVPDFSEDDKKITYEFQTSPLSGKRVLAQTLSGNKIKIYEKLTKGHEIVASPHGKEFLLDPIFIGSNEIIYKIGDAVNGAYGGGIGFEKISLNTKKVESIYEPKQNFGLFNLIGNVHKNNETIFFTVYIPQDNATWMANKYSHLLLSQGDIIHDFGIGPFRSLEGKLAISENDSLTFVDDNHDLRADTNFLFKYKAKQIVKKKPLNFAYENAILSPNGKLILLSTESLEFFLMDTNSFKKTKLPLPKTAAYGVSWSDDSKKMAIIQAHEKLQDTDLISLFEIY